MILMIIMIIELGRKDLRWKVIHSKKLIQSVGGVSGRQWEIIRLLKQNPIEFLQNHLDQQFLGGDSEKVLRL
jgi:hypothetical protein